MSEAPRVLRERAPAKINLCLFLGGVRADGLHELVSVVEQLSLADELELRVDPEAPADTVVCPGVDGPNLAAGALAAFREATGWDGPPLTLTIRKRIPVAAGMGGGSSDAAAALRLAAQAAGIDRDDPRVVAIAPRLGADVPVLLDPGPTLVTGAGEALERIPSLPAHGVLVIPLPHELAAAEVYREADRLGLERDGADLAERRAAAQASPFALVHNDLEPAARSLCPAIDAALEAVRGEGAAHALVSGSGPTVLGIFPDAEAAERAAANLRGIYPRAGAEVPSG